MRIFILTLDVWGNSKKTVKKGGGAGGGSKKLSLQWGYIMAKSVFHYRNVEESYKRKVTFGKKFKYRHFGFLTHFRWRKLKIINFFLKNNFHFVIRIVIDTMQYENSPLRSNVLSELTKLGRNSWNKNILLPYCSEDLINNICICTDSKTFEDRFAFEVFLKTLRRSFPRVSLHFGFQPLKCTERKFCKNIF